MRLLERGNKRNLFYVFIKLRIIDLKQVVIYTIVENLDGESSQFLLESKAYQLIRTKENILLRASRILETVLNIA